MANAFKQKLGDDADEVAKVLLKHRIPRDFSKQGLALAEKQARFTIFSIMDALATLARDCRNAATRVDRRKGRHVADFGRGAVPNPQPLDHVIGIHLHVHPLLDQIGDSDTGPQLGRKTKLDLRRIPGNPGENLRFLLGRQLRLGTAMRLGCQALGSLGLVIFDPSPDRPFVQAQKAGNFRCWPSLEHSLNRKAPPTLQLLCRSVASHTRITLQFTPRLTRFLDARTQ